jgi:pyrimidine-nucleoside phosphorylase|nr:pyrimidine-nucleoside phosphorylase [uncultured Anaerostipes sp.]
MRMYDLILKKRQGNTLTKEEIQWMIREYTDGKIPDYQMSAMMMAVCFQGLDKEETYELTMAMAQSGEMLDLSGIEGVKVDKHSTGGVGDKTSLALTPIVASLGIPVAKMSGRGLGHTGGTIDKLESIPGFSTQLTDEQFEEQVNTIGVSIMGQTKDLAPADKLLYALRDVTATVDQISLIASSIMSKKLAAGADAILLDVKTGSGAFMKEESEAVKLAQEMVDIGKSAGRKMTAVITNMDEPLGMAVGNILEVKEAIDTLKGNGPKDFTELVETLASHMLILGGIAEKFDEALSMVRGAVRDGKALDKFKQFVSAQGGDTRYIDHPELFEQAHIIEEIRSEQDGFVERINAQEIGICSLILGGGRETKDSQIDPAVGLVFSKKVADPVKKGDLLATIYGNDEEKVKQAVKHFKENFHIAKDQPEKPQMIKQVLS